MNDLRALQEEHWGVEDGMPLLFRAWLVSFLLLLLQGGGSYGSWLEKKLGEVGFDEMDHEDISQVLWKMEREGLIFCDRRGGGFRLPQRWYEMTSWGEEYLEACADSLARCRNDVERFLHIYSGGVRS